MCVCVCVCVLCVCGEGELVGGGDCVLCAGVIDILQVQYKPFLLLAAQLQTIHEQVQVCESSDGVSVVTV